MATHSPNSTITASAQPILNFWFGPTVKPGAHLHTPHQLMSTGSGEDSGIVFSTLYKIPWTHSKSTTTECRGWSLAIGNLKSPAKWDNEQRKGQMSGKMQEICTSFPWRLNAQWAEYLECGVSQESDSTLMVISFPSGKDTDHWFRSQLKPIYIWITLTRWVFCTPWDPNGIC